MKTITICGKEFPIDCNAFTYIKYQSIFKSGIIKDMQFVQDYLIKQTVVTNQIEKEKISEVEKITKVSNFMVNDTDEFIIKITQIAWILIYTANHHIEDYETWLQSIDNLVIDDDWIAEVTEFAVSCFC